MKKEYGLRTMAVGLLAGGAALWVSEGNAEIQTSFPTLDDGCAQTCEHKVSAGSFSMHVEDAPEESDELIVEGPWYSWSGPSGDHVSFSAAGPTAYLALLGAEAFGTSYGISCNVSWFVTDISQDPEVSYTVTAQDDITLDAFRFDFDTESDPYPEAGAGADAGGGALTDNRTATVTVIPNGCSDPSHITSIAFTAKRADSGEVLNKRGTNVGFSQDGDILTWKTTKTYWYGLSPDKCCYTYQHAYEFEMTVNNCCKVSKEYAATMPNEEPRVDFQVNDLIEQIAEISEPETVNHWWGTRYRCGVKFKDFPKSATIVGIPTTNQYNEENKLEEEYHVLQWMGQVSGGQGGQGDCYTAKGVVYFLKQDGKISGDGPWYYAKEAKTPPQARLNAIELAGEGRTTESDKSYDISKKKDKGFMEVKAKAHAGYNAAWKYHCTYRTKPGYGEESAQTDHRHPAYEE